MATSMVVSTPTEVINNNRSSGRFGELQYPIGGSTHGVYMEFNTYEYGSGSVVGVKRAGSIALPLPLNINDTLSINVQAGQLGVIGAGVADIAARRGNTLLSEAMNAARSAGEAVGGATSDFLTTGNIDGLTKLASSAQTYANFFARAGLTSLSPEIGQALSVASGTAVNPHATLVFDGVTLKNFDLRWQLAPKNDAESIEISNIIRTIKTKILPRYAPLDSGGGNSSLSRALLKYPNMVDIYFVGLDPSRIFKFKRSMVRSFTVDYSPHGNVLNKGSLGSAPAFVNLDMSFTEAEIWTAEDFETQ